MAHTASLPSYQQIASIADFFSFPKSNKAVSTYKKVIEITTNKKSVSESQKFVSFLEDEIIPQLPVSKSELNLDDIHAQLENTKVNQLKVNKMFDTIDTLFDGEDEVSIDDTIMLNFLSNMKKAQELLTYIYNYLLLIIEVHEANENSLKNGKSYTFEEFTKKLNIAA